MAAHFEYPEHFKNNLTSYVATFVLKNDYYRRIIKDRGESYTPGKLFSFPHLLLCFIVIYSPL
jgi:hypothetical protein